jgi:hypothetical protein
MFTLLRHRLLAAVAVLTLCCLGAHGVAESMHALKGCTVSCCSESAGETSGHGELDGAGGDSAAGCPHAYCCHGGAAIAEEMFSLMSFHLQVVPHDAAEGNIARDVDPEGIEYPPQLG